MIKAIVTMPPYAPFLKEVLQHPVVSGIRLNTVMPVTESLDEVVKKLNSEAKWFGKDLYVDLKCRQLRVKDYGVPPFTEINLSHNIEVNTPVTAYFSDGQEHATVLKVEGNKLIMQDGPRRVIGPGESVNIRDPSLKIDGYLTDTDKKYIEAGNKAGAHKYMLSFVEKPDDIKALKGLDKDAEVVSKIESLKGLQYVQEKWQGERLMTARGDLYVEVNRPHNIIQAEYNIIKKDPNAIVASRILGSLSQTLEPSCADIADVDHLMRMGYQTLMLGDDICMRRESVLSGLNILLAMSEQYARIS